MSRPSSVSAWRCVASCLSTTTCSARPISSTAASTRSRVVDRFRFPSRSYGTCYASDARSGHDGSSSLIGGLGSRRPTMTTLSSIDVPLRSLTCSLAQRIRYASTTPSTTPGLTTSPTATASSKKDKDSLEEDDASAPDLAKKPAEKIKIGEIRRLMVLARPERKTIAIAIGLLFVSSSVSLSIPFTIGRIIDLFSGTAPQGLPISVPTAAAVMALFFAIGASANMGRTILMRISGQRIVARLREAAYTNVLRQDIGWHDLQGAAKIQTAELAVPAEAPSSKSPAEVTTAKPPKVVEHQVPQTGVRSTGDIISRLGSDCGIVGESLTRELSEGLRALVTATVGIGAMLWISAKLTAVMMLIVPPISIAAVFYGRYLKKLSTRTQQAVGEMVAVSEERLGSIRTVQAFNAVEPLETQRFSEKVDKIFGLAKKEAFASGLFYGGAGFAGNLSLIALLTYGGTLVAKGALTTGQLTSLMVYTFYIGSSLFGLTSFFGTIMKGLGASSRIFELLDARPVSVTLGVGKPLPVTTPPRRIIFDDVHFAYPSRPQAEILKGVNLTIETGQIVSIAGGSGSGKSTLANLLVRYYDPSQGRVVYGEDNIRDFTVESWRQRIAIVPQDPALFSTTIAENIAYGRPNASRAEIEEAAKLANCGFIEALPRGFDTLVGARGAQLSGGQRQRLAIARALLQKPKILVCDEATSALDAASESLVNKAISNISSSHSLTTILIAHRLSTLKTADRVVLMDNGVVAEQGTYDELTRSGTRFSQLVASQMLQGSVSGLPAASKMEAPESL
ncbi:BZ3500_MvSof-1268-A1-R1_Chr1-3g02028 [Microbotryum saponariae]|uniref:BZ3500_MvSof-1268-A1-R1_Chr1-3g02028 protein n=1 Tax=Microbotryum saponariae TaxID=289078 RepID=A0A2X0KW08_9BASI|nr:BZ3500_MvSof-1268-A1-R1_Chr1-3g02028 [Microbotryum saponariae]SCZ95189.1 BZ3501_MvSof-1269-A2-R1_Chr1-3g01630 [Microbotryum saponariae]